MKNSIFTFLLVCVSLTLFAQKTKPTSTYPTNELGEYFQPGSWQIYAKGGLTQFYGELNSQKMSGLYGVGIEKRILPFMSLALDFEGGNLQGSKKDFYNSRFRTDFGELNLLAKINFTKLFSRRSIEDKTEKDYFDKRGTSDKTRWVRVPKNAFKRMNLSAYAGFGAMRFNAVAYDLNTGAVQRYTSLKGVTGAHTKLGTYEANSESGIYYTRERTIPLGIELSYLLSEKVSVSLDYRVTLVQNNDKVDATSGKNNGIIGNGNDPNSGPNTVSSTANDAWGYVGIKLGCFLGKATN